MKCNDINYKEFCRGCIYLYDDKGIWCCDLDHNLKCENKYIDCMIAEEDN